VKYKTLFRLMLKIIGVWLIVHAMLEWSTIVYRIIEWVAPIYPGNPSHSNLTSRRIWEVMQFAKPFAEAAVGLYLFFGGEWIVNKAIPSNRAYCHECGYMLKNLTGTRCPECDTPFRPDPPTTPPTTA
jgi:hypothetical protein